MGRKDKPIDEKAEKLSIGTLLRQARLTKGISLTAMANILHLTKGHLSGVENDRVRPSLKVLQQYEQVLALYPGTLSTQDARPLRQAPAPWNVPFARNPFFVGREDLLARIHQQFQAGRTTALGQKQALLGLGGSGKTQLAVEYAYRFRHAYQAVLWVRAEQTETLNASYLELAHLLLLPERDAQEQVVVVLAVKRWLQTRPDWLLILDNADEPDQLTPFLPASMGGQVLFTTRAAAVRSFGVAHPLIVETFPPEPGALFLLRRAGLLAPDAPLSQAAADVREQAVQITQELGGLPLALDQAGAYVEATGTSLDLYRHIYQYRRAELLRERRGAEGDHPEPVATTWLLSFQRVEEKHPAAADLLRLCAFLAPDAIGEEILLQDLATLHAGSGPTDPYLLDQAVETLRAYSLLIRDAQARTLCIHRLVQAVVRDALDREGRLLWMQRAVRALAAVFPPGTFEHWPLCERLLPHALFCARWIADAAISLPEAATLLHRIGHYQCERGQYDEVERFHTLALTIRRQRQEGERDLAESLMHLGYFYSRQGRYEHAETLYAQALALRERVLGGEHPETAQSLNDLAGLYSRQGKYEQARPLYAQALAIRERVLGSEHPETARSLDNLAGLYSRQGRYDEAQPLYEQALSLAQRALGSEHPNTAQSLNNLAGLYARQGRYDEAQPLYEQALAIRERVLGGEHPETANSVNNLGDLYLTLGKYDEAQPLYELALAIRERVLGGEHPETARSLNNLAGLYARQGRYDKAQPLYELALAIRERVLGGEHPETVRNLHNLARLYARQEQVELARPLYERALAIRERVLGGEHPETAQSLNDLARLYARQDRHDEAQPLYERALAIRERVLGGEHPDTATSLNDLAEMYARQGQDEKARALYRRALSIRERVLGPQHPKTQRLRETYLTLPQTND